MFLLSRKKGKIVAVLFGLLFLSFWVINSAHLSDYLLKGYEDDNGAAAPVVARALPPTNKTINQTRPHPLAGARYPDGMYGYVADVTAVRRHYLETLYPQHVHKIAVNKSLYRSEIDNRFTFLPIQNVTHYDAKDKRNYTEFDRVCETPPGKGFEGKAGYEMIKRRIQVNAPNPRPWNISDTSLFNVRTVPVPLPPPLPTKRPKQQHQQPSKRSRILCIVYTHEGALFRMNGIASTWGWRCDGFMAASTLTQMDDPYAPGFGSVDLPHLGPEKYGNMWQKTRSIVGYCYLHYLQDFEYFYILGDDTHVIVENLRNFLHLLEYEKGFHHDSTATNRSHDTVPLYIGDEMPASGYWANFAGGGAGYLLNRAAVRVFIENANSCLSGTQESAEDRFMGFCMVRMFKIPLQPIVDAQNRSRWHHMDPNFIAAYNGKSGYFSRLYRMRSGKYGGILKAGHDQVSTQTVTFHILKTPERMKRLHAILYRSCPIGTALGDALQEWDNNIVPTSDQELEQLQQQQQKQ